MRRWLGALEGYYGHPLRHEARLSLIEWMSAKGFNVFVYAPKDDPLHRTNWRDPYPDETMRKFDELVRKGREASVEVSFTLSPGLDWKAGDEDALVGKMKSFAELGCEVFGVLWDDVPPGGRELGEAHARATAAVVDSINGAQWWTVGTDYALVTPTEYLSAFAKDLPKEVSLAWTGPSVTPLTISGEDARTIEDDLGRTLLLWENFPVNDSSMKDVLHLGPYPQRSPDLVDATQGVLMNMMEYPLASKVGLACGARFWTDPTSDREKVWQEAVAEVPGLEPLARACRSWASHPGPDPMLVQWADAAPDDKRLRTFLEAGCRAGLDPGLADEVGRWLDAWDVEAEAMLIALDVLEGRSGSTALGIAADMAWSASREQKEQLFGIRHAVYPTGAVGAYSDSAPAGTLTDRLCWRAVHAY